MPTARKFPKMSAVSALKFIKKKNLFHLQVFPTINMDGMDQNEKAVLLIRTHPIFFMFKLISITVLTLVALITVAIVAKILGQLNVVSPQIYSASFILVILIALNLSLLELIKWFYNLFLITSERLLDIDLTGIVNMSWSSTHLTNIEDVEARPTGVLHVLLNLGNIYVQTAAAQAKIEINNVKYPTKVQDILLDLVTLKKRHT